MAEKAPLFLAKASYRSRRLSDAARLLPVLAVFLWFLPALWPTPGQDDGTRSQTLVYLFIVWAGLIIAAALIARGLARRDATSAGPGTRP